VRLHPGSVIGCDEDCSANIFCSAYGAKECLPDGTWGACKENSSDAGLGGLALLLPIFRGASLVPGFHSARVLLERGLFVTIGEAVYAA
jgi:hypothetical protein